MLVLLLAALPLAIGCSAEPRWKASELPIDRDAVDRDAARLFRSEGAVGAPRDPYAGEVADVPMRRNMRPCCAFGTQLRVRVGPVPVPLYFLGNLVDRRSIKSHVYDSGNSTFGSRGSAGTELLHSEGNGLAYSCRAGFLDIAHIRDNVDSALYTITSVARLLETGGEIAMPNEGAGVRIALAPVDAETLRREGRWSIAIPLGQWLAFQSAVWHEISTWFGWSTFALFPERVSSFSPEDLYSDLLGVRIAAAVISQGGARDEFVYNRNVGKWLDRALEFVQAVPVPAAKEAMLAVDGLWWDSTKRIPDFALVKRRKFEIGGELEPWLVPPSRFGPQLAAACGNAPEPLAIVNPEAMNGIDFASQASLVIDLPGELASREPFVGTGGRITQEDFPRIVAFIREQSETELGPESDTPDIAVGAARP